MSEWKDKTFHTSKLVITPTVNHGCQLLQIAHKPVVGMVTILIPREHENCLLKDVACEINR